MASLSEKMQDALNGQINAEMYSSYLYLSMAAFFESVDLSGFASWMHVQAREEELHVHKIFNFIVERGGRVVLEAIEKPPTEWKDPLDAFQAAYAHEQRVSALIADLVTQSREQRDAATESFLRWFVDEQVEEESNVDRIVKMLRMSEGQPAAMFMIDRDLSTRVFTVPAGMEGQAGA